MSARPRVLLADDHAMLLEAFTRMLSPSCDIVGAVGDGRALLEAAPRLEPDVIVLDIAMPVMDGLTFLERKKEADRLASIPVVVVSATARGPIADVCCVLAKPVDPHTLLETVLQHAA
jgi:CheY-like chemotaxis protein